MLLLSGKFRLPGCIITLILMQFTCLTVNSQVIIKEDVDIGSPVEDGVIAELNTDMKFDYIDGREILSERTMHKKVFELSNGHKKAVISTTPVHFKNKSGKYEDIAPKLIKFLNNDMVVAKSADDDYSYEYTDGLYQVFFKENLSGNNAVKISCFNENDLYLTITGIGYFNNSLNEYRELADVNLIYSGLDNGSIIFSDIKLGIEIKFTYGLTNLKRSFKINHDKLKMQIPAPAIFNWSEDDVRVVLETIYSSPDNLEIKVNQDENIIYKSIKLINNNQKTIVTIPVLPDTLNVNSVKSAIVNEYNNDIYSYNPIGLEFQNSIAKTLDITGEPEDNSNYETIFINLPEEVIDYWIEGGWIKDNYAFLIVGKHIDFPPKRTYLKFLIRENDLIPENSFVHDATLAVNYYRRHKPSWSNESFVPRTINVGPAPSGTPVWDSDYWESYGQKYFNVTTAVQYWVDGYDNNGMILWASNENVNGYDMRMSSSETANGPCLVVDYSDNAFSIISPEVPEEDYPIVKITEEPKMPAITCKAKFNGELDQSAMLGVDWECRVEYDYTPATNKPIRHNVFKEYKGGAITFDEDKISTWDLDFTEHDMIIGGKATIKATMVTLDNIYSDEVTVYIRGTNPGKDTILEGLDKGQTAVIMTESINYSQFYNENYAKPGTGLPLISHADYHGWGLCQIDDRYHTISPGIMWDWKVNREYGKNYYNTQRSGGKELLENKGNLDIPYTGQTKQSMIDIEGYARYNGGKYAQYWAWIDVEEGAKDEDNNLLKDHWEIKITHLIKLKKAGKVVLKPNGKPKWIRAEVEDGHWLKENIPNYIKNYNSIN